MKPTQLITAGASILDQGEFEFYKTTSIGIKFKADTPRDVWLNVVEQLSNFHEGAIMALGLSSILLGDSLNFGEERFGEEFAQAIDGAREALGLSPSRVSNIMSLTKKFPQSRRREGLSIGHYDAVSGLEEKDADGLLDEAAAGEEIIVKGKKEKKPWSVAHLREVVADRFPKKRGGKKRSKAKAKESDMSDDEARDKAVEVLGWLKAHEEEIGGRWQPVLGDYFKLFRRVFQGRNKGKK